MAYTEAQRRYYLAHREEILERHRTRYRGSHDTHNTHKREDNAKSIQECDKTKYHQRWTIREINYLTSNYQQKTIKELANDLGRTIDAVERKRNKLGLIKEQKDENRNIR